MIKEISYKTKLPIFLIIVSLCIFSCNESLPIYVSPSNVLSASVAPMNLTADTVRYRMDDENNPNLISVRLFSAPLGFEIKVVNIYSETIQDNAAVQGSVELVWVDKQEFKATLPLSITGIVGPEYDPMTGLVTLNPGDTVTIRVFWDYHFSNNEWAFTKAPFTDGRPYRYTEMQTAVDRFHDPMMMHAAIKIKLFRSLSFVNAESKNNIPVLFKGQIISQL